MTERLIEVKNLTKHFLIKGGFRSINKVQAVDNLSFYINRGETLGLVGESGCGKTTVGRTLLRLYEPTSGKIFYNGKDITKVNMKPYRSKMQIIFQDPYASLDPRMTIGNIVSEPLDINKIYRNKKERSDRMFEILDMVGLSSEHAQRYPHEFSGGQRQRIGIARALAVRPDFIVCDEPVSALDVSIQAQIINILMDLQKEFGLTYLFIAHDLAVVKHISNRIGVMYLGQIVELYTSSGLHKNPMHPYTQALLSAIPVPDPEISMKKKRIILQGDVSSPINPPKGCRFHPRCFRGQQRCLDESPELLELEPGHFIACHFPG
ncbi:MAG: ABC transporter ATP-binding protein [Actinomycetota bacterium]